MDPQERQRPGAADEAAHAEIGTLCRQRDELRAVLTAAEPSTTPEEVATLRRERDEARARHAEGLRALIEIGDILGATGHWDWPDALAAVRALVRERGDGG